MHFRFRSFQIGGDWSHQSGEYCQEEGQGLHLWAITIRYRQINGSSEGKEGRFKSEEIIRVKLIFADFNKLWTYSNATEIKLKN